MLCSRCKRRPAMVFIATGKDMSNTQGLCIICAKELGLKPVNDLIDKMGISEEELSEMQDRIAGIFSDDRDKDFSNDDFLEEGIDEIARGGAATFPFIKSILADIPFGDKSGSPLQVEKSGDNGNKEEKRKKKAKRRYIDIYCTNLNTKAKTGKIDKIVGRDEEISRVIQILCRRTKNNPCLVGEPGVGKTAIAEGLASRIVERNIPYKLQNKEIHLLDLTALVAGTQFRGQFESRIKGLIDEIKKDGNIVLFIDEVHNLVGTGDSEGSMSAANILKPALSRGEIQVIGATTFDEYRKYIEKDSALERRFQQVKVTEPSLEKTVNIIKGIKSYYETYHRVAVSDALANRIVILSERYITDRFLPDKAIDLLDESCAYAALRNKAMEKYDELNSQLNKVHSLEEKLMSNEDSTDYKKLAEIRCEEARLEEEIEKLRKKAFGEKVEESDIAYVIELWTGIPASKIQENEFKKLLGLEDRLKEKIVGQDQAIEEIVSAIKRNRIQINPKRRPASFIFVGSTGVGKTELVKILAKELFDAPDALIRVDMSEYMEKHSVSKLIGSPPGYVGYDEAGQITEKVRQRPYSVILFDEIEKAHPDIMNILLQILDEGKITDSHGRKVNFENTVIVMTSNAGSDKKTGLVGFAKSENDITKEKAHKALSEFLRPEFLSRVDEIVVFNKLTQDDFEKIASLSLKEYVKSISEQGVKFEFDKDAIKELAKISINGKSGARDLLKTIRKEVEDKISETVINNGGFKMKEICLFGHPKLHIKTI